MDVYQPTMGDGKRVDLNGGLGRAYFGQKVSQFDLIANNIENAFDAMR